MLCIAKKIFILPLIFSLIFAPIICCCSSPSAHAEDSGQHLEHAVSTLGFSHCGPDKPRPDHSEENHHCECPKLPGALAKNIDVLKSADVVLSFLDQNIIYARAFLGMILNTPLLITEHSPPLLNSNSLPLYIKNSVLRL